jgi:hypothetical protein
MMGNKPQFLYHATYKRYLDSIKENGLGGTVKQKSWDDSVDNVVCLAHDEDEAESYAETADITEEDEDTYYQRMAPVYYGEAYNANKHYNALPHSARNIRMANNYLIPTQWTDDLLLNFRLRMNIAPNSVGNFSTDSYLLSLGFDSSQYGKRKYTTDSFKMENRSLRFFRTVEANGEILPELIVTPNKFRMSMDISEVNFISEDFFLKITKKDSIKNERFETELKKVFMDIEKTCNISYGVTYNATTKRFQFQFPSNNKMTKMKVVLPGDLAERLGFKLNGEITPKKVSENH